MERQIAARGTFASYFVGGKSVGKKYQRSRYATPYRYDPPDHIPFEDSGVLCPACSRSIPLKYRGSEESPEAYHLDWCDKCYEQEGIGSEQTYEYDTWGTNFWIAAIYWGIAIIVLALLTNMPLYPAGLIFLSGVYPFFRLVRYLTRKKITPQTHALRYLREINELDKRMKRHFAKVRAEAAALEKKRLREASGIDDIDRMDGVQFENRLEHLFQGMGYTVVRTPTTGDQGLDLILTKGDKRIGVQAKRYQAGQSVGNAAVQEVIGGVIFYDCDQGWVVTNSYFTDAAKALANKAGVRLIDRQKLITMLGKGTSDSKHHSSPKKPTPETQRKHVIM